MKPRKVIVTLEIETDVSVDALKIRSRWVGGDYELKQVHVQVVQPVKKYDPSSAESSTLRSKK